MENQITFAAIHGTILSIIIGLSSVYVVNLSNIYNELEQNTVSEALWVNKIKTNPAWYEISLFAKEYYKNFEKWQNYVESKGLQGAFTQDVFARRLINLIKNEASKDGEINISRGSKKISFDWLSEFREKHSLSDIEEILCIMTLIRLSKPFKQILVLDGMAIRTLPATLKIFDKTAVHNWLMEERKISELTFEIESCDLKEYLNKLKWPDGRLFVKMSENLSKTKKNSESEDVGLKPDPKIKSLLNDFIDDIIEISDIWYSTVSHMRRLNNLDKKRPEEWTFKIGLILSIFTFFSAVLYPLACSNALRFSYVHVPIGFYVTFSAYILWKVFAK